MIKPVSKDEQMSLLDSYMTKMIETKGQLQHKARLSDSISFQETKSTVRSTRWNGQPRYVVHPDVVVERELVEPGAAVYPLLHGQQTSTVAKTTPSNYAEALSDSDEDYDILASTPPAAASIVAENAHLNSRINEMEQENTKLKEEIERIRKQSVKGEATNQQADEDEGKEQLQSKILVENRQRFMRYIDQSIEDLRNFKSDQNLIFLAVLMDLLYSSTAHYALESIKFRKDSPLYLFMPAAMVILNLMIVVNIYSAKGAYVQPFFLPGSSGPRLIAQALNFLLSCLYFVTPSSAIHLLVTFKIVLNIFSCWRSMEETVYRESTLRAFAEIVADYHSLVPVEADEDDSEEQAAPPAVAAEDIAAGATAEQPFFVEIEDPMSGIMLSEDQAVTQFPFVSLVIPRTEVEQCGVVRAGHEILSINGISLEGTSADFAYSLIDNIKGPAKLELRFNPILADFKFLFL